MKRIFFISLAAVAFALGACSSGSNTADAANVDASAESSVAAADPAQAAPAKADPAKADPVKTITDGQIPAAGNKLAVIDFNATWCGPCRAFAPTFHSVAAEYAGKANFYSVDVDVNPELAARFGVQSIPTIVYLQPDGSYTVSMGNVDRAVFVSYVKQALAQ